jgi:cell division cycle 2-like protein
MKRGRWDEESEDEEERKKAKASKKAQKEAKKQKQPATVAADNGGKIQSATCNEIDANETTSSVPIKLKSFDKHSTLGRRRTPIPYHPSRSVDNYERLNFIDQGTYGMVFRARCLDTNEVYALKQIKMNPDEVAKIGFPQTAFREINILLALNHPNIIKVREMVIGSTIDKIYMVMEYCENDLKVCMHNNRQSFSTAEIKQLLIQLLSAIDHMHSHFYLHRDLKTSNLLYSNKGILCVCDFGLARKFSEPPEKPYTFEVVTLHYRAPELLLGSRIYSSPIDMWSVGCILGEMLLNETLFYGEGEIDQINKIFRVIGQPTESTWPGFSSLQIANQISWHRFPSKNLLRERFPKVSFSSGIPLSDSGLDLLSKLLDMNPATVRHFNHTPHN